MKSKIANLITKSRDFSAKAFVGGMLLASGTSPFAAEFTDRVNNAKTIDSRAMRDSSKGLADNWGFMVSIAGMLLGLGFFIWGILWIMKAGRSEGRKEAGPGWMMLVGGAALGTVVGLFAYATGVFSGATS